MHDVLQNNYLELPNILQQLNKLKEETVLNDNYKREIIDLGTEMLKKKCKQYDDEVSKNLHIRKLTLSAIFGVLGNINVPIQKGHLRT